MSNDQNREQITDVDDSKEAGNREIEPEKGPREGSRSSEEDEPEELDEVTVTLVEDITKDQDQDKVSEQISPESEIESVSTVGASLSRETSIGRTKQVDKVEEKVSPSEVVEEQSASVSVGSEVEKERVTVSGVNTVRPEEVEESVMAVTTASQVEKKQELRSIQEVVSPSKRRERGQGEARIQGRGELEIEVEEDPVFAWGGGSPYGSRRPKFVVHIEKEELPSLEFLHVLLRDTYKELEQGEPGAESVEFMANEPRIPQIQDNIVTLDLTEGEWSPSTRDGRPVIERSGIDIVPKLQEVAQTLYTGELGYFVLNLPSEWEHPIRRSEFFDRLVNYIAGREDLDREEESGVLVEQVKSSPVVKAKPRLEDRDVFMEKVARYFSLSPSERFESVSQVEEVAQSVLRRNDWRRVMLTERQQEEGRESSEHYFWKAAIVEGLTWQMYQANDEDFDSFENFVREVIFPNDWIETEKELRTDDEGNPLAISDIYVQASDNLVDNGLDRLLETDTEVNDEVAIEFETGISEGAFNFRKFVETLDKYSGENVSNVSLVVPPRLLFRGKKRAEMINDIVEEWNESEEDIVAEAFVPALQNGVCKKLKSLSTPGSFIDTLYQGGQDE